MTPELKLKRGDTAVHFVKIPIAMYQAGMNVYFMVKPAADDDNKDAKAVISKHLTDNDIITKDTVSVKYKLSFTPDDTDKIMFNGEKKQVFAGEFEFRAGDQVYTYPSGDKFIKVTVYPDIRRGQ
jgi:hypothetical protein|nr:MAG TPA: hypothetical protein [Caudoviricetes sp.]